MRIRYCAFILLLVAILLSIAACREIKVSLGQEFSLGIGESALIQGEELQIKFLRVVTDSRCPRGVTCIWEGEVSCMVEITYQESLHQLRLTEPGLTNWPQEEAFKQYRIAFHVEPYPEAGIDIAEDEYRLLLRVSK